MTFIHHHRNSRTMAEVRSDILLVEEPRDILDIMANAGARILILGKSLLHESFFDLKSGFAGEMLQKISNYGIRLAVVGDFSGYPSKSLRDFIRESNRGGQVLFTGTVEEALERFSA